MLIAYIRAARKSDEKGLSQIQIEQSLLDTPTKKHLLSIADSKCFLYMLTVEWYKIPHLTQPF